MRLDIEAAPEVDGMMDAPFTWFTITDQSHKSHIAPDPYPTMHQSEQKCVHFCSEWYIVGYGPGGLWDLWIRSILLPLQVTAVSAFIAIIIPRASGICDLTMSLWVSLQWRHNDHDCVSNHQPHGCLLIRLLRRRSKKHQSSASLAFVWGMVNSPHKRPVTRKMFPF